MLVVRVSRVELLGELPPWPYNAPYAVLRTARSLFYTTAGLINNCTWFFELSLSRQASLEGDARNHAVTAFYP